MSHNDFIVTTIKSSQSFTRQTLWFGKSEESARQVPHLVPVFLFIQPYQRVVLSYILSLIEGLLLSSSSSHLSAKWKVSAWHFQCESVKSDQKQTFAKKDEMGKKRENF